MLAIRTRHLLFIQGRALYSTLCVRLGNQTEGLIETALRQGDATKQRWWPPDACYHLHCTVADFARTRAKHSLVASGNFFSSRASRP